MDGNQTLTRSTNVTPLLRVTQLPVDHLEEARAEKQQRKARAEQDAARLIDEKRRARQHKKNNPGQDHY
jgi:hypothetical protein